MEKYSWNFNEDAELWYNESHDTVEDCIAEATEENALDGNSNEFVYIGENLPFTVYIDAEYVLEQLEESACDFCGEASEGWNALDYKKRDELKELSNSLTNVVNDWLKKYGREPSFYRVENIKPYSLKKEDTANDK